jgi:hypothetical protein
MSNEFSNEDYWRAIILYGLNQSTYKIALGKSLVTFVDRGLTNVSWDTLSIEFLNQYRRRLNTTEPMPQLDAPGGRTNMERICLGLRVGQLSESKAVDEVSLKGFGDVIPRFHNLGRDRRLQGMFFSFEEGKNLYLKDELFQVVEASRDDLVKELDARWGLLEGAFSISAGDYALANDVLEIYLKSGYPRKPLTGNVPFLQGYQGNICFYCGESMGKNDRHVDHVLPRHVLNHDEIWNLVLAHDYCNSQKSGKLVNPHFIAKLVARNENIMGSNHPWKAKIASSLGNSPSKRKSLLLKHYDQCRIVIGPNYWGGTDCYNPESDPFYRRFITVLNNDRPAPQTDLFGI